MVRIFIGVAWPYANGPIHIGHVAGSLLAPDIFARYHRMKGNEVLMVSGSDQHGTPITVTAEKEGVRPEEIAERYHEINAKAIEDLGVSFDLYLKTSHPSHKKVVQEIFLKLLEKGHIYKETMIAPYCENCKRFLPDRYVEGECPHCAKQDARGDQCDECGKTLECSELIEPRCKLCKSEPKMRETEHFFFRLSAFEDPLKEYIKDKDHWRPNTMNFTRNWLQSGLKDRAVTRDLTWGIEIPVEGFEDKRIYVWFEAVMGYFSMSREWARRQGDEKLWEKFWKEEDCRHYYFLAKDNIPFHTIIWPAILMGYGDLNLPYDVPANEYLRWEGEQFSKSRGISIEVPDILQKYHPDQIRYYLTINMPESRDSDFTWEDFIRRNNDELVSTLGNFIHRAMTFTHKHFGGVPEVKELSREDDEALETIRNQHMKVQDCIEKCEFKKAMKELMELAHAGNRYFDSRAPWALIKENKEECGTVLHISLRIVKALAIQMAPFLPFSADKLWQNLGYEGTIHERSWDNALEDIPEGQVFETPKPLFTKLVELKDEGRGTDRVKIEKEVEVLKDLDIETVDLRVGKIVNIEGHPNADKLYVLSVDFGTEKRQLVAGLKPYYPLNEMVNKHIVVVTNLEPAKLRGVKSDGMLLAADDGKGGVTLLTPSTSVEVGSKVVAAGTEGKAESPPQISFKAFQKIDMRVGSIVSEPEKQNLVDIGDSEKYSMRGQVSEAFKSTGKLAFCILQKEKIALPLLTQNGVPITIDRDIKNGAKVK